MTTLFIEIDMFRQFIPEDSPTTEVTWYFEPGWIDRKEVCVCTAYFKDHFHTVESRRYGDQVGKPASLN